MRRIKNTKDILKSFIWKSTQQKHTHTHARNELFLLEFLTSEMSMTSKLEAIAIALC